MRTSRSRRSHGASKPRVSDASKLRVRQGSLGCTRARLAGWRCSAPGAAQVGVVPGGRFGGKGHTVQACVEGQGGRASVACAAPCGVDLAVAHGGRSCCIRHAWCECAPAALALSCVHAAA